ncbi:MAG TPA: exonuclease SbcCD subunit D [Chloroflexia bacterium]|nr:exonuclease SbcCD subunit D [Chloroflexia bacterium]
MMRILHLADVHLGMENYGKVDPTTGLSSRLGDFLASLDSALNYAIDQQFDLVLLAGDVYKNRDPTPTVQREFARRIHRLSAAGIPVFLLVGNHDLPNTPARAHTVEIFDTLAVPNVWVARMPDVFQIPTAHGIVQVAALPWITHHGLLTKDEFRGLTPRELNSVLVDRVEALIDGMVARLDPALPAIFTAHAAIDIAKTSSEHSMMLGDDLVLPLSMVARPEFDYVALGHIHKYQVLHSRPPVVYPGSLERIDFGEERDPKGFVAVTLDEAAPQGERRVEHEFHDSGARRFVTVEIHTNGGNPNETVLRQLDARAADIRGAIVRVLIKTTAEQEGLLRDDEIRKSLSEAAYVAAVSREVDTPQRTRLGDLAVEQLTPLGALKLYLSTTNVPMDRAATLLQYGADLIGDTTE